MKKGALALFLFSFSFFAYSQDLNTTSVQFGNLAERFPVFPDCVNLQSNALETCFYNQVQDFVFTNFEVPDNLKQNNFKGTIKVLFEVDGNGVFKVIYVDATDEALIKETKMVFGAL